MIDGPARALRHAAQGDLDGPGDWLGDRPRPTLSSGGIVLRQLEDDRHTIAGADLLVGLGRQLRRQTRPMIGPILEAKAVKLPVPRLEEGNDRGQIVGAADAIADIIAPPTVRPAGIALLVARGQFDDLGAPLRPAARATANRVREPDLVECHVLISLL